MHCDDALYILKMYKHSLCMQLWLFNYRVYVYVFNKLTTWNKTVKDFI